MKKVWIFGGSFCTGYQFGGGRRDWIAQLDADVTVWACNPQSPRSQFLMLQHAFCCSKLETKFQSPPDYIIYDYPRVNRVHLPTALPESEQTMTNYKKWSNSRTGHRFECGCESDNTEQWSVRSLTTLDEWHEWRKDEPGHAEFVTQTKRAVIKGELPDHTEHQHTASALDLIKATGIPYCWYSANNSEHLEFEGHQDRYIDIHNLNNNIPTQAYNSKTFNHLSIVQNIMWADYFNSRIS